MQRNHWAHVVTFVLAVTIATAILVAAGLGERTGIEYAATPTATDSVRR